VHDIPPDEVRRAMDRVLSSPGFVNAGRLSRMLRFVVERMLAGEGDQLKEYLLGVEVFDRPSEYDPRLDSIVRVEARRLRSKLAEYYQADGAADTVRFRVPKGGYLPVVERLFPAEAEEASSAPPGPARTSRRERRWWLAGAAVLIAMAVGLRLWWSSGPDVSAGPALTVAVLPFHVFSGREDDRLLADRLTDGVTTELARHARLGVTAHVVAAQFRDPQRSSADVSRALGVRFLMETTAHVEGDAVRLEVRLVDAAAGRKLWVEDFRGRRDELDRLERLVADAASGFLVERYGAVSRPN
jgi:TolB-like protein